VVLLGESKKIKTEESQWNWNLLEKMPSVKLITGTNPNFDFKPNIIIDGILGTGISGEIREPYASAINFINNSDAFKFAVDVPSGLDPNSGNTANIVVKANLTVTFHKMKKGMPKRNDLCGEIIVEKIGIPPEAEKGVL
ncbi:MAG: NAD(P)H-hydrate epimerase, partial [Thaumarchaeota archaeon]|nr:NAD(P)H-hydrate epimerase [Nitrososphaerota archaeon]